MKKVKCVAIQTARSGSQGVPNKNTMLLDNKPLFLHNIINLNNSKYVNKVYLTTDIQNLEQYKNIADFEIIKRPDCLADSKSSHYEAMKHAYDIISKELDFDYVCIVLGNSIGALPKDIDYSIEFLDKHLNYDSCESVAQHNWHTPIRAYTIMDEEIVPFINDFDSSHTNDRDILGNIYFFNGSFFVIRKEVFLRCDGTPPFRWGGKKIKPVIQDPKYMEIDYSWQLSVLRGLYE